MKITAKQLALSLYESLDGKPTSQVKAVIKRFMELLAKKNQLAKAEKIIAEFLKIWNIRHGIVEAKVVSAKALDKETVKLLKKHIASISEAKEVIISQEVDKKLLGGVVIRYGDKVLDGSLRGSLQDLKSSLEK